MRYRLLYEHCTAHDMALSKQYRVSVFKLKPDDTLYHITSAY